MHTGNQRCNTCCNSVSPWGWGLLLQAGLPCPPPRALFLGSPSPACLHPGPLSKSHCGAGKSIHVFGGHPELGDRMRKQNHHSSRGLQSEGLEAVNASPCWAGEPSVTQEHRLGGANRG